MKLKLLCSAFLVLYSLAEVGAVDTPKTYNFRPLSQMLLGHIQPALRNEKELILGLFFL